MQIERWRDTEREKEGERERERNREIDREKEEWGGRTDDSMRK